MNITNKLEVTKQELPPLIKQSATYKLIVPRKVEEKIRYLIRKYPHTEWSGVLFYTHTGSFEDNNLVITCEDLYPMDLGTSGWTEFKMTEDVTAYIAENIDLFDCETGLVHSHHTLGAFFSGQDTHTLQVEGNDTNCFVSLIVDTKGTYVAAITRKIQTKFKITTEDLGTSYEFFGEGSKAIQDEKGPIKQDYKEKGYIEYFMCDVEREVVDNPLEYLDYRFNEIEKKKEEKKSSLPKPALKIERPVDNDQEFFEWLHSQNEKKEEIKEGTLFTEKEMEETEWHPNPTIIHYLCCQLLTSSLIVNKDIDLKQWVIKHMAKKYEEIFDDFDEFDRWAESMVEFILNHYNDPETPSEVYNDWDSYLAKIANAIIIELQEFPYNTYLDSYIQTLERFAYE